jgi:hypothetical protein
VVASPLRLGKRRLFSFGAAILRFPCRAKSSLPSPVQPGERSHERLFIVRRDAIDLAALKPCGFKTS